MEVRRHSHRLLCRDDRGEREGVVASLHNRSRALARGSKDCGGQLLPRRVKHLAFHLKHKMGSQAMTKTVFFDWIGATRSKLTLSGSNALKIVIALQGFNRNLTAPQVSQPIDNGTRSVIPEVVAALVQMAEGERCKLSLIRLEGKWYR
jgi:hypothetical protein